MGEIALIERMIGEIQCRVRRDVEEHGSASQELLDHLHEMQGRLNCLAELRRHYEEAQLQPADDRRRRLDLEVQRRLRELGGLRRHYEDELRRLRDFEEELGRRELRERLRREIDQEIPRDRVIWAPVLGHKLACFLIPANRQEEVIGDFDERYATRWLRMYGPTGAEWCYIWQLALASFPLRGVTLSALVTLVWKLFRGGG
jgi:hypothetical protein